jgi:hypothetical protein
MTPTDRLAKMRAANCAPETLAKSQLPGFVPLAPGRLTGWIPDAAGHWRWTGALRNGMPYTSWASGSGSVARLLWLREGRPLLATESVRRTCAEHDCVAPDHHAALPRGVSLLEMAKILLGRDA